jgi:transcriptional regulator with XRE-family HTH domain
MTTNMPETSKDNFGRQLAKFRIGKGLTQNQFALALGYRSRGAIQQIEAGECLPSIRMQIKLAKVYGITVDEIRGTNFLCSGDKATTKIKSYDLLFLAEIGREKQIIHRAFLELTKNPGCTCYDIGKLKNHERKLTAIEKYLNETIPYLDKIEKRK